MQRGTMGITHGCVLLILATACLVPCAAYDRASYTGSMTGYKACSDGIVGSGEECDDGNLVANDGCSPECKLENPSQFVCTLTGTVGPTSCCPAKTNPVTNQKVCDCRNQASDDAGYTISQDCRKVNINECFAGTAQCHKNAVCEDKDATVDASQRYTCTCPPGLVGDGVSSCDLAKYETKLVLSQSGTTAAEFDADAFKSMLYAQGVIPADIDPSKVYIKVSEGNRRRMMMRRLLQGDDPAPADAADAADDTPTNTTAAAATATSDTDIAVGGGDAATETNSGQRRLLQSGALTITLTIYSDTESQMQNITGSVNTQQLASAGFVVVQLPTSTTYQSGDEPTSVVSTGFRVLAVQFDDTSSQWLVDVRYTSNVPNTITSLYVSKPGTTIPYSQEAKNAYYVSKHPCVNYNSVCCLPEYVDTYQIGAFKDNITALIGAGGTCDAEMQARTTLGMFHPAGNDYLVEHVFDGYPDSSVERISSTDVRLRIAQSDLSVGGLAMRSTLESNPAGYQLQFFVGMTFFTLLDANAMSVAASQTFITLAISNSISFSFASSQDASLVKYITLTVMQNKWIDNLVERRMQFIQMGFVLPAGTRQDMQTGLVPLTSVRFAIAKTTPDRNNASLWTNPCFSGYGRGLYDATQGYRDLYRSAAAQACASDYNLCANPLASILPSNFVNFYFPIGDRTLTPEMLAGVSGEYNIYVMFQLSSLTSSGKHVVSNLYARAPLRTDSVVTSCDSVTAISSLLSTTKVDITVGFVGTQSDWDSSMRIYSDVTQAAPTGGAMFDTTPNVTAPSLQQALITIVLKGSSSIFSRVSASNFYLEIEQLSVIHFLDTTRFNTIIGLIRTNRAYSISSNPVSGRPVLSFTPNVTSLCASADSSSFSCALYTNIYARSVTRPDAVHPLATGINTTNLDATRDWLMANILKGTDEYSYELSTNMTSILRENFDIDDRVRKAWFVNPGNKWVVNLNTGYVSDLLLSDKIILTAIMTLNDGGGNILRRRLMSFTQSSSSGKFDMVHSQMDVPPLSTSPSAASRSLLQAQGGVQSLHASWDPEIVHVPLQAQVSVEPEEALVVDNLHAMMQNEPRAGALPAIQYNIDVPDTLTRIFGVEDAPYTVVDFFIFARFDELSNEADAMERMAKQFYTRLIDNKDRYCQACKSVIPVFSNLNRYVAPPSGEEGVGGGGGGGGGRRLLQTNPNVGMGSGSVSVMFVYDKDRYDANQIISVSNVQAAVYSPDYSVVWSGNMDPAALEKYVQDLKNQHIVLHDLSVFPSATAKQIQIDASSPPTYTPPPPSNKPYRTGITPGKFDIKAFLWDLGKYGDVKVPPRTSSAPAAAAIPGTLVRSMALAAATLTVVLAAAA